MFRAGLGTGTEPACWEGRDPIGPTKPIGPVADLGGAWLDEGESAPGEELEVTGGSEPSYLPKTGLIPELGEEALLARVGDWRADWGKPSGLACPGTWVRPNGSTLRGDGPRKPEDDGVALWPSGRGFSSTKVPGAKNAGLSLPYSARCWRARRSRRLSSFTAAGLTERSDLFADTSASRP